MEAKVQIVDVCDYCQGKAYLPYQEAVNANGEKYIQHKACPQCKGTGKSTRWIPIHEFLELLFTTAKEHELIVDLLGSDRAGLVRMTQGSRYSR